MSTKKYTFYSLNRILAEKAQYNLIIGEKSNGKTYAVLDYAVQNYFNNGKKFALIRRVHEDFTGKKGSNTAFNSLSCNHYGKNRIKELSRGRYVGAKYWADAYYLTYEQENEKTGITEIKMSDQIIGYGFNLSDVERYNEGNYPDVTTIIFDEFMTRGSYLPDEYASFMILISDIKRKRSDVKIFMMANTITRYCPYFAEMGITHVKEMKQGDIDLYEYGSEGKLRVAIEYAETPLNEKGEKETDIYFAFDNPTLKMITGGSWDIDIYPHLLHRYDQKDVIFKFYIVFDGEIMQGNVIGNDTEYYMYIHRKTTPLLDEPDDLIYSFDDNSRVNYVGNIFRSSLKVNKEILMLFKEHKVFYQSNDIGDMVYNFLKQSRSLAGQI